MGSRSGGPLNSDPDQWWHPDWQNESDYDFELDPYADYSHINSVKAAFKNIGGIYGTRAQEIMEKFGAAMEVFRRAGVKADHGGGYHVPHPQGHRSSYSVTDEPEQWHMHLSTTVKPLTPLIEVTQGHWAVCQHKPRCKKPGPGANFNQPVNKKRRPRISNR
jgi:hypothetical protein